MGRPPGRGGQTKARGGGTAPQLSGNEEGRGGKNQQLWGGGGGGLLRLGGILDSARSSFGIKDTVKSVINMQNFKEYYTRELSRGMD